MEISDCATVKKSVDSCFKVPLARMTNEYNFTLCVNKHNMRNSLNSKLFIGGANTVSHVIVFNIGPSFNLDVFLECAEILVYAQSNQSNFVSPGSFIFYYHLLVVVHRFLTRWAPSCPKVKQNYLTELMLYIGLSIFENIAYI